MDLDLSQSKSLQEVIMQPLNEPLANDKQNKTKQNSPLHFEEAACLIDGQYDHNVLP